MKSIIQKYLDATNYIKADSLIIVSTLPAYMG